MADQAPTKLNPETVARARAVHQPLMGSLSFVKGMTQLLASDSFDGKLLDRTDVIGRGLASHLLIDVTFEIQKQLLEVKNLFVVVLEELGDDDPSNGETEADFQAEAEEFGEKLRAAAESLRAATTPETAGPPMQEIAAILLTSQRMLDALQRVMIWNDPVNPTQDLLRRIATAHANGADGVLVLGSPEDLERLQGHDTHVHT
jgi:hypothetical protein